MRLNIEIPASVNFIIEELERAGYEAYMVGGCVRDSIMNRSPHDYDICTSATPEEILSAFPYEDIIPTGLKHGTVTILINHEPFEITTYRIDGEYSDNRRPDTVEFTTDLIEDLRRRDFTINAMAYNPKTGLIDPFGGLRDIKYRKIKCVGSPRERFEEDALRILRAIRFSSQLGFFIARDTDLEMRSQYKRLTNISVERINSEFCKIVEGDFSKVLVLFSRVFELIIPEISNMIGFKQNNPFHSYDVFFHTIHALKQCESSDLIIRLAVFFHDIGKPHSFQDDEDGIRHFKGYGRVSADMTDKILKRLKFDNDTRSKVVELVSYHDSTFMVGKKYVKRWLNKIGEGQFRRLLIVRKADIKGQKSDYSIEGIENIEIIESLIDEVLSEKQCFSLKDLAVNGKDLIEIGYIPGQSLGAALQELLECVIAEEVDNEKEILLEMARKRSSGL